MALSDHQFLFWSGLGRHILPLLLEAQPALLPAHCHCPLPALLPARILDVAKGSRSAAVVFWEKCLPSDPGPGPESVINCSYLLH